METIILKAKVKLAKEALKEKDIGLFIETHYKGTDIIKMQDKEFLKYISASLRDYKRDCERRKNYELGL